MTWWEITTWAIITDIALWWAVWIALEYFWLSVETVIIMSVLLALDFFFWVLNVYIKDRKNLSSTLAWEGLWKKMTRRCLPFLVVAICRGAWLNDMSYLSSVVCGIIIVSEGYSILGHIYSINSKDGSELPEIDALEALIQRLAKLFKWVIDSKTKDKEE